MNLRQQNEYNQFKLFKRWLFDTVKLVLLTAKVSNFTEQHYITWIKGHVINSNNDTSMFINQ